MRCERAVGHTLVLQARRSYATHSQCHLAHSLTPKMCTRLDTLHERCLFFSPPLLLFVRVKSLLLSFLLPFPSRIDISTDLSFFAMFPPFSSLHLISLQMYPLFCVSLSHSLLVSLAPFFFHLVLQHVVVHSVCVSTCMLFITMVDDSRSFRHFWLQASIGWTLELWQWWTTHPPALRARGWQTTRCCALRLSALLFVAAEQSGRTATARPSPMTYPRQWTTSTRSCRTRGTHAGGRSLWLFLCTLDSLWRTHPCGSWVVPSPHWTLLECCRSLRWSLSRSCVALQAVQAVPMPRSSVPWSFGSCCSCTTTLFHDLPAEDISFSWTRCAFTKQTRSSRRRASRTWPCSSCSVGSW